MATFLDMVAYSLRLITLFAEKMPDLYAEALSRFAYGRTISVEHIIPFANLFLEYIHTYAFPLYVDSVTDLDPGIYEIPVVGFAICEDELSSYKASSVLTVLFVAVWYTDDDVYLYNDQWLAELIADVADNLSLDEDTVHDLTYPNSLNQIVSRLSSLPEGHIARDGGLATIDIIRRESDNIFIDTGCTDCGCDSGEYTWDDYDFLVRQWEEAEPTLDLFSRFVNWLYEGGPERETAFVNYITGRRNVLDVF